jgi:hypothetical protein
MSLAFLIDGKGKSSSYPTYCCGITRTGYAMLCDVMFTIFRGQDTFTYPWYIATVLIYF